MSIYEENSVLKILQNCGNISMDAFRDRLRLQKIAYLSQQLNSDGGFSFTYYHYGPYSPSLTKLLYKGVETNSFSDNITLNDQETATVGLLNELVDKQTKDSFTLELFATIWYLLPIRQTTVSEQQEIIKTITETKPRFDLEKVRAVMDKILEFRQTHGILN